MKLVNGLTYDEWVSEIDDILDDAFGISMSVMSVWLSHDAWSDGHSPLEGAHMCCEADDLFCDAVDALPQL